MRPQSSRIRRIVRECVARRIFEAQGYYRQLDAMVDEVVASFNACRHKKTGKITAAKAKKFTIDAEPYLPPNVREAIKKRGHLGPSTIVEFFVNQTLEDDGAMAYFTIRKAWFASVPEIHFRQDVAVCLDDPSSVARFKSVVQHELFHMLEHFSESYSKGGQKARFDTDRMKRYKGSESKALSTVKYFFGRTEQNAYLNTLCRYIQESYGFNSFSSVKDAMRHYSETRNDITHEQTLADIIAKLETLDCDGLFAGLAYEFNTTNTHRNDSESERALRCVKAGKDPGKYGFGTGYARQGDKWFVAKKDGGADVPVVFSRKNYDTAKIKAKVLARLEEIREAYVRRLDKAQYATILRLQSES